MAEREVLIARKHDVRRRLEQARRQLEHAQATSDPDDRRARRLIAQLESQVDALMAQEYALRVAIDRSR